MAPTGRNTGSSFADFSTTHPKNPILMAVVHVIADERPNMALTSCDDMIEKLPATASDAAFRDAGSHGA